LKLVTTSLRTDSKVTRLLTYWSFIVRNSRVWLISLKIQQNTLFQIEIFILFYGGGTTPFQSESERGSLLPITHSLDSVGCPPPLFRSSVALAYKRVAGRKTGGLFIAPHVPDRR